jgi:CheY-like chemotaxis protein
MPREVMAKAFEPFFTTKPRGKGTGLGLAMVYGFFRQSGGTVRLYSEVGYGTTVSFYLPFAETVTVLPDRPLQGPLIRGEGAILIVDDEVDLLEVAVSYVNDMGFTALEAKDGPGALEVIRNRSDVGLLITDIIMPGGMNGVELAVEARKINPVMKVIYCSGFPAGALAERSMPLVDGPLLRKPYQRNDFNAMVQEVMYGSDLNRQ